MRVLHLCLIGIFLLLSSKALASPSNAAIESISDALDEWDAQAARRELVPLLERFPTDPLLGLLEAHLLYLEGRYQASVNRYETLPSEVLTTPEASTTA